MEKEELISELSIPFYIKSSKGNILAVTKKDGKWIAQGNEITRSSDIEYIEQQYEKNRKDYT